MVGLVVLVVGWWGDVRAVRTVAPGLVSMKANTASNFIMLGVGLAILGSRPEASRRRAAKALGLAVAGLGLLTLVEYLVGASFGLDTMLAADPYSVTRGRPAGRMSGCTGIEFVIAGLALGALAHDRPRRAGRGLAARVLVVGLLAITGYLYDVNAFYEVWLFTSMAIHTSVAFALAGAGLLAVAWRESEVRVLAAKTPSGSVARALLPATLAVPILLGGVIVTFEGLGSYPGHFSMMLLALGTGVVFLALVSRTLVVIGRLDAERSEVRRDLGAHREWFQITLASIGDAVVATDQQGVVTFLNSVGEELTGWTSSDAQGRPVEEVMDLRGETDDEPSESPLRHALRLQDVVGLRNHTVLVRRDGSSLPIEDSAAPIRRDDGVIVGAVLVFRDVSERRREEARRPEYLAMLAHELRNPLAPILGGAELLAADQRSAQERQLLNVIIRQATHLSRLVDDMLDLTRLSRGRVTLVKESCSLEEACADAVAAARPLARDHQVTTHIGPEADGLRVHADPERLHQVLFNLLSNAIKYTPPGGTVDLHVKAAGDDVRIRVVDDGRGIEPAELEATFEPFVQAERSLDRSEGGLGLGLAVVREIVSRHDGIVVARSEGAGSGTEVVVTLPRSAEARGSRRPRRTDAGGVHRGAALGPRRRRPPRRGIDPLDGPRPAPARARLRGEEGAGAPGGSDKPSAASPMGRVERRPRFTS